MDGLCLALEDFFWFTCEYCLGMSEEHRMYTQLIVPPLIVLIVILLCCLRPCQQLDDDDDDEEEEATKVD